MRALSRLPLRVVHALGACVGTLARWVPNRYREYTFCNLEYTFPERSKRDRRRLMRQSLREDGKTFAELGALWLRPHQEIIGRIREVRGLAHVEAMQREQRGIIFASPHLGAWELLGRYVATLGELLILYRPPRKSEYAELITELRSGLGATQIPAGARGVRQLIKALRRGASIGILPDQQPYAGEGVFAPFFGMQALTMTLLPKIAQRTGAPVIVSWAERLPRGRGYVIHFTPPWHVPAGMALAEAAAALNERVEACVRMAPAQYQWNYKRFSERPPGGTPVYPKDRQVVLRLPEGRRQA